VHADGDRDVNRRGGAAAAGVGGHRRSGELNTLDVVPFACPVRVGVPRLDVWRRGDTASVKATTDGRYTLGAVTGLASAALFGISAPGAKLLLPAISPWLLAGLLYLGAGIGLSIVRLAKHLITSPSDENNLRREDLPRIVTIVIAGGALGPTLMLIGLTHVPGVVGSLLLNLEAVFTMLIAVLVYRERLGRYETFVAILVIAGAIVVSYQPTRLQFDLVGALAIAGACLCWAVDNNLTRTISFRNPVQIVQVKTLGAGVGNVALAF